MPSSIWGVHGTAREGEREREGEAEKVGLPGSNCMARSGLSAAASGAGGSADGACKGKESLGERAKTRDLGSGKGAEWPEQVLSSWQSA